MILQEDTQVQVVPDPKVTEMENRKDQTEFEASIQTVVDIENRRSPSQTESDSQCTSESSSDLLTVIEYKTRDSREIEGSICDSNKTISEGSASLKTIKPFKTEESSIRTLFNRLNCCSKKKLENGSEVIQDEGKEPFCIYLYHPCLDLAYYSKIPQSKKRNDENEFRENTPSLRDPDWTFSELSKKEELEVEIFESGENDKLLQRSNSSMQPKKKSSIVEI